MNTEEDIIGYLNFSEDTLLQKAKRLGYKKTTINCEGKKISGYRKGESFFQKLKSLIDHHKRYPLGFDYYYWGFQIKSLEEKKNIDKNGKK